MTNAAPPSKSINDEIEQTLHGDALIKKKLTETINQMNNSSESASKDELNGLLNNFIGASGMPDPGSFENLLYLPSSSNNCTSVFLYNVVLLLYELNSSVMIINMIK